MCRCITLRASTSRKCRLAPGRFRRSGPAPPAFVGRRPRPAPAARGGGDRELDPVPQAYVPDGAVSTALSHAVYGFFLNGGRRCFVVNAGKAAADGRRPRAPGLDVLERSTRWRSWRLPGFTDPPPGTALLAPLREHEGPRGDARRPGEVDSTALLTQVAAPVRRRSRQGAARGSRRDRHAGAAQSRGTPPARPPTRATAPSTSPGSRWRDPLARRIPRNAFVIVPPLGPHRRASTPGPTPRAASTRRRPTRWSAAPSTSTYQVTPSEQDELNPAGINCIRVLHREGIRVWGARTLRRQRQRVALPQRAAAVQHGRGVDRASAPAGWCSSPTTAPLWKRIRRDVSAFLRLLWRDGALMGAHAGAGLLRQVRRGDQPAGVDRRRAGGDRLDRHRPGEAGRVRHLPHRPVRRWHHHGT